ncbi:ATP-dependent DNA ligase [Herbiconiux sp. L3-i23]|uniref:DUF7882 family protein n=1 Tax=Herbiconiux sp. L3-i23 TaxID=2905871 RepID=UPI00206078C2|nr:ATP-dependent DNA ligase [Herbiconiux sp. L3-i23]BDI22627.1 hypothetical protein L3i23_14030 [Herbiconiux sp. L3-i23]
MGSLSYDGTVIAFDDRLLAHLQIVIVQQFRRRESFVMSWLDALSVGDGRSSIWLHPDGDVFFKFDGSRAPSINKAWLDALTVSARSSHGLVVTQENGELARSTGMTKKW